LIDTLDMIWMDTDMLGRFAASVVYIARKEKTGAERSRAEQSRAEHSRARRTIERTKAVLRFSHAGNRHAGMLELGVAMAMAMAMAMYGWRASGLASSATWLLL
jgi:hypothetical protein